MNKIKKGDTVLILLGKDRGKSGLVTNVLVKDNKVAVEAVNTFKRHVRKYQGLEGGVINITKPLDLSNVALVCPKCKKATRVGFVVNKDGKKIRVCKKCKGEF